MASFHADIPQVEMTLAEDLMELSSEPNPPSNTEDVDIDLLPSDLPQEHEDDFMAEDIYSATDQELPDIEAPQAGNDDEMFDDENPLREFQDSFSVADEDLDDAEASITGDGADTIAATFDDTIRQQSLQSNFEVRRQDESDANHTDTVTRGTSVQHLENGPPPTPQLESIDGPSQSKASPQAPSSEGGDLPKEREDSLVNSGHGIDTPEGAADPRSEDPIGTSVTHDDKHEPSASPVGTPRATTDTDEPLAPNANSLQTSPYVHPVVVVYQNNEMSLFPPVDQDEEHSQTYFLQDESYATASINNLLGACRSLLGENVNEQDELEIRIEELGLHISESAPESSTTTLVEILDIYVQLQLHDGLENPGPLYIVLCTKVMFSQRMKYLINAVAEGKGFSQLALLEPPDEDDPQFEDVEQRDAGGEHYLQDIDSSAYVEVDGYLPLDVADADIKKEESKELRDHKISRSTESRSNEIATNTGSRRAEPRSDSTPLKDEAKMTQLSDSDSEGKNSTSNDAGAKKEQIVVLKADEKTEKPGNPLSGGTNEPTLGTSEATSAENEDVINYDEEEVGDDTNNEISTRSSTIQGDSIEGSKFDVTATTEIVLDNNPTDFGDEQLEENGYQQDLSGRDQTADGIGDVLEADEDYGTALDKSHEFSDDDLFDIGQQGEDSESESEEQRGNNHEQDDIPSPSPGNEFDNPIEATHDEDLPATKHQTNSAPSNQMGPGKQSRQTPNDDMRGSGPPHEHHTATTYVEPNDHDHVHNAEDLYDFTVDGVDTSEIIHDFQANRNVSNGYGRGFDHPPSTSTNHIQADQTTHKVIADVDEIDFNDTKDDFTSSTLPIKQGLNPSPGSLKRMRTDMEDDVLLDSNLQDHKRNRSN